MNLVYINVAFYQRYGLQSIWISKNSVQQPFLPLSEFPWAVPLLSEQVVQL